MGKGYGARDPSLLNQVPAERYVFRRRTPDSSQALEVVTTGPHPPPAAVATPWPRGGRAGAVESWTGVDPLIRSRRSASAQPREIIRRVEPATSSPGTKCNGPSWAAGMVMNIPGRRGRSSATDTQLGRGEGRPEQGRAAR